MRFIPSVELNYIKIAFKVKYMKNLLKIIFNPTKKNTNH